MLMCQNTAGWEANGEDPDETPRSVVSDLLHSLLRPVCPITNGITELSWQWKGSNPVYHYFNEKHSDCALTGFPKSDLN